MGIDRRAMVKAGLAAGAAVATAGAGRQGAAAGGGVIELRGGDAVRGTIPRRRGRLELDARERPGEGWFAEYEVTAASAAAAGTYRLVATATVPVEHPQVAQIGSYVSLGVNGEPCREVAHSQPHWYEAEHAGGDLCRAVWRDVELHQGSNTLTVRVEEQAVLDDRMAYRLRLERLTLTRVPVQVAEVEWDGGALRLRLNGRATEPLRVPCRVTDYFGAEVVATEAAFAVGRRTAVLRLPELPAGHYRVRAGGLLTRFAVLSEHRAVPGAADRFGVNAFALSLIPPSRLDRFAEQLRAMGAGYVRGGAPWPVVEPRRGSYDTTSHDRVTAAFRAHGLRTLEVVSAPPEWAMTVRSLPLPDDLRDAYRYGRHLARHAQGSDVVQVSNEPDVDDTRSTGDVHAAYVKALALGLRAAPDGPTVLLPGIAEAGSPFQRLMLLSEVARYADAWAFHGYPDPAEQHNPQFPAAAQEQHELLRAHGWEGMPAWMTESGVFLTVPQGHEPTADQERAQARYLVRSLVQGLAEGNARQLWFDGPPTHDEGVWFSLLARDFSPLAAYSAHAALAGLLGEARFQRPLPDVAGYVFADGRGHTVTVVWADAPQDAEHEIPVPAGRVRVYDVMGRHRETAHTTGAVRLRLTPDPLYLVADGSARAAHTDVSGPSAGSAGSIGSAGPPRPSAADHVVLNQRWPGRNAAPGKDNGDAPPPHGYRLGRTTRMTLEIYNFADRDQYVELRARVDEGWEVSAAQQTAVRVPAQDRTRVAFTIRAGSRVRTGRDHTLAIEATADGRRVTPSVSWIQRR
ncbi:hypothetical protein IM697_21865 [Streptomyces ferrugineus]|uniref:Uncharacterized protein n=1 Tax=Streptomyces ferrugineus TaxID=1413221 RepID=A0A7M2SX91_9ACTN|nr:hypothetical protein [Streptomyces ferrugineus]QOV40804.1 hypothetical protein IM697_21865 [Streptomyces ferrugineus]